MKIALRVLIPTYYAHCNHTDCISSASVYELYNYIVCWYNFRFIELTVKSCTNLKHRSCGSTCCVVRQTLLPTESLVNKWERLLWKAATWLKRLVCLAAATIMHDLPLVFTNSTLEDGSYEGVPGCAANLCCSLPFSTKRQRERPPLCAPDSWLEGKNYLHSVPNLPKAALRHGQRRPKGI